MNQLKELMCLCSVQMNPVLFQIRKGALFASLQLVMQFTYLFTLNIFQRELLDAWLPFLSLMAYLLEMFFFYSIHITASLLLTGL